jgi:anhydro-N-acetylmuramic acid kinase
LYHQEVFGQDATPLAVVNLGGIANMTVLSQRIQTYGYDLGPGNCLMDAWIQKQLGQPYDRNGAYAAQGVVIPELLEGLLTDDYFQLPYPKSVCKSYFSLAWLQRWLRPNYAAQDVQATLLALTVKTIVQALNMNVLPIQRLAVCGGGAHNQAVLGHLRRWLPEVLVKSTKDLGVDPDFLEAMMFAWLAHQTLTGTPLDLTHITGAMKPTILGAIYPA